jgi:hypothetical protein
MVMVHSGQWLAPILVVRYDILARSDPAVLSARLARC